jgi:hypothetical protein
MRIFLIVISSTFSQLREACPEIGSVRLYLGRYQQKQETTRDRDGQAPEDGCFGRVAMIND